MKHLGSCDWCAGDGKENKLIDGFGCSFIMAKMQICGN